MPQCHAGNRTPRQTSQDGSGGKMRTLLVGMLALTGASFATLPSSAAPLGDTRNSLPEARLVEQAQMSGYCRRLRRACEFKRERDEVGEGNCRRYRRECGRY